MKDSTKIKLQKALFVLAGLGSIGFTIAYAYTEGRNRGHEAGYREGFEAGKSEEGDKNAYYQGVQDAVKAHRNYIYDPYTYKECGAYVSEDLAVSTRDCTDYLDKEDREVAEKDFGKDFKVRMVFVGKPAGYDDIPHLLPLDDAPKSIEEQPDVPAVDNVNGEEVG